MFMFYFCIFEMMLKVNCLNFTCDQLSSTVADLINLYHINSVTGANANYKSNLKT
jgi:hypothetical protein